MGKDSLQGSESIATQLIRVQSNSDGRIIVSY